MNNIKKIMLLSFISAASFSSAFFSPMLPAIKTQFSVSSTLVQQIMSFFLIGYVVGQLIYGPIANSFGRLKSLRIGFVINILGVGLLFLATLTHSFHLLLLGRVATAFGASAGLVCTFILIREYFSSEEAKSMLSYAVLSFTLGVGIAVFCGGFLIEYFGLQASLYILLIHAVMMFLMTYAFIEPNQSLIPLRPKIIINGYKNALKNPTLIYFSLVLALTSGINYCYTTAAPLVAINKLHLTASAYGIWNGFNLIGMCSGALLAKKLLKHLEPIRVIMLGFIATALCLLIFTWIDITKYYYPLLFFITSMFTFAIASIFFPAASFLATQSHEEDRASASSVMSFINMGGACLLVMVMSALTMFDHLTAMLVTLGSFLAVLVILYVVGLCLHKFKEQ